jgi:hypothetical protein
MGVSNEAKNVIPVKFLRKINFFFSCELNPGTYGILILLGIHVLFGTELAMTFSFHVGLTDSVMQQMQFFFLSVSVRHFLATALPDLLF